MDAAFDLEGFLPYRLNRAADAASAGFAVRYRARHHMTRPEWRVLALLGRADELTAAQIVRRSGMHKTKVSRAVAGLERRGWLRRATDAGDRRIERLDLTADGRQALAELAELAREHQAALLARLGADRLAALESALAVLMEDFAGPSSDDG
ncbi:MarR family transcriptional regulator [Amaricoccus sp.]|uniref:MarR family winged helix-turn-helix transcriptional regulator n=1 Tax=Amaricoccus sp. TaxID=1872485 RepID=UPI001B70AAAB|nr:MarR family transcriptional regulator [Amaricoccus sp.]MBP7000092.1 MarR family transcriptional regulator [Amaricoccus sp.]